MEQDESTEKYITTRKGDINDGLEPSLIHYKAGAGNINGQRSLIDRRCIDGC